MKYFKIEPEVPGGLGDQTIYHQQPGQSLKVIELHVEFEDWLGDCLFEVSPCFFGTKILVSTLINAGITGFEVVDIVVTASDNFKEINPSLNPPECLRLLVHGADAANDIYIYHDGTLCVSEKVLCILKGLGISNAVVEDVL